MPALKPVSREEKSARRAEMYRKAHAGELRLPEAFREMRQAIGLTQAQFAQKFRLTRKQVIELENGKSNPTLETVNRLAVVFGFTVGLVPASRPEARSNSSAAGSELD